MDCLSVSVSHPPGLLVGPADLQRSPTQPGSLPGTYCPCGPLHPSGNGITAVYHYKRSLGLICNLQFIHGETEEKCSCCPWLVPRQPMGTFPDLLAPVQGSHSVFLLTNQVALFSSPNTRVLSASFPKMNMTD